METAMSGMHSIWRHLLGIVVGSAWVLTANCATAQIRPDRTLPNNSTVTMNGSIFNITGGTQAGRNLFHSFQQFSIPTGGKAIFNNGLDIQNIFSRVTGGSVSSIDGVIQANGTANVFFLNPNGIVFGKNASLSIGGSFVATTANAIQFGNLGTFSASVPNSPALLTVNPSALLYNQIAAGASIQYSLQASANGNVVGLQVPAGKSLLLVGGDVTIDGGRLRANGGHVELGGLVSPGTVGLGVNGNNLSLSFPLQSTRGSVSLLNGANVSVSAGGGGSITVNASNLNITGGSSLIAGIGQGLGNVGAKAGDITINATGDIKLDGSGSRIADNVGVNNQNSSTKGNGGNIEINTNQLELTKGAQLQTTTFAQGNAGSVIINATKSVSLDGNGTLVSSRVQNAGIGNAGNIQVNTGQLSLTNGAQLIASTLGHGSAGDVIINATKSVSLDGNSTGVFSRVQSAAVGNAGNIQITTDQLSLSDSAQLVAETNGKGNAGNVIINATKSVSLIGNNTSNNTIVSSRVEDTGVGNAGNIQVNTGQLSLTNSAQLLASTLGQGNAGDVIINATKSVSLDGSYTDSKGNIVSSGIFSRVGDNNTQNNLVKGNGGNIQITTDQLSLSDGARLVADTYAKGNAGNVIINATKSVSLDSNNTFVSGRVQKTGVGNAGNIQVNTGQLSLTNNAQLIASTLGQGNAGGVIINATKSVSLDGNSTGVFSRVQTTGVGNAGNIQITTNQLSLSNGAQLVADTYGRGNAGNILIVTDQLSLSNSAKLVADTLGKGNAGNVIINATKSVSLDGNNTFVSGRVQKTGVGNAGNIQVNTGQLSLTNNAQLIASTLGHGNAGDVIINATKSVSLDGNGTGVFSRVQKTGVGNAGNIQITTDQLSLTNNAQLVANTLGKGNAGNVIINATKNVTLDGIKTIVASTVGEVNNLQNNVVKGNAGNIQITTNQLSLSDGAQLQAETFGQGNAGNVIINATKSVSLDGNNTGVFSVVEETGIGKAGNLQITTNQLSLTNGAFLKADTTSGQGNITIHSQGLILLSRGSKISANASGTNVIGGNINIDTDILAVVENSKISADSSDFRGGQIGINAQSIFLSPDSSITAHGANQQLNGTVQIKTPDIDSTHGLVILPTVTEQTPKLVSSNCAAFNEYAGGSSFNVTGRGGLPPSPNEPLISEALWTDTRLAIATAQKHYHKTHAVKPKPQPVAIIPATAWVFNDKGEVTLISTATNATSVSTPTSCPTR
jgi:filamentous hemagglutinin family protein